MVVNKLNNNGVMVAAISPPKNEKRLNIMEKLKMLVLNYESSIINDESNKAQMKKYLMIEKYINKHNLSNNDLLNALKEVGALSQMSVLYDWYEDLIYRMEAK